MIRARLSAICRSSSSKRFSLSDMTAAPFNSQLHAELRARNLGRQRAIYPGRSSDRRREHRRPQRQPQVRALLDQFLDKVDERVRVDGAIFGYHEEAEVAGSHDDETGIDQHRPQRLGVPNAWYVQVRLRGLKRPWAHSLGGLGAHQIQPSTKVAHDDATRAE